MKPLIKTGYFILLLFTGQGASIAQSPEILRLKNKTFDAYNKHFVIPPGWTPQTVFLGNRSIKQLSLSRFYREEEKSQKGNTHVALATYANGVRENLGQKLKYPMIPGHRYSMDMWLAWTPARSTVHPIQQLVKGEVGLRPIKIQVFGFASENDLSNSLLAETPVVDHSAWRLYTVEWTCSGKYEYVCLVATCPGDETFNGNILMDNVSDIRVQLNPKKK